MYIFFYGFDYNEVLFETYGCSNIRQLHYSASRAFFVQRGGRGEKGKGKEKLPHANIYSVISFNCTLVFNLPWTNAFKTAGVLLKSCWTKFSWLLWPYSLTLSYLTTCIIPFIPCVKRATQHLELERRWGRSDWASFLQVHSTKD